MGEQPVHSGGCHCGAVSYRARGLRDIWFCHCRKCRALTGHYIAVCLTEPEWFDIEDGCK